MIFKVSLINFAFDIRLTGCLLFFPNLIKWLRSPAFIAQQKKLYSRIFLFLPSPKVACSFPTVSGCWSRYTHNLSDNSLRFKLLFFKANFSKQCIIYILNGGWNSTTTPKKRDKDVYCTGQKKWRKVLTVQAIYSTLGVERTVEKFSHTWKSNEAHNIDFYFIIFWA